jgi:hypothetical protein
LVLALELRQHELLTKLMALIGVVTVVEMTGKHIRSQFKGV